MAELISQELEGIMRLYLGYTFLVVRVVDVKSCHA